MSDIEDRKAAKEVLKKLRGIPQNELTVTQMADKTEAKGILSRRDFEREEYRKTTRTDNIGMMGGGYIEKEMIKKKHGGKIIYKMSGGRVVDAGYE